MKQLGLLTILVSGFFVLNAEPLKFNRDIRPILSEKCFFCHGPDDKHREAKLRLDIREMAMKKKDGVQAIIPGNSKDSEIIVRMLDQDPDSIMPPPKSHKEMTKEEIDILKRWIDEGAVYEKHWSFAEIKKPSVPMLKAKAHPIDRFILTKIETENQGLSKKTNSSTLLRRLSFDLTGLPPNEKLIDRYTKSEKIQNVEKLVDELIQSPHFGERFAMMWLDLVRYADSHGYHSDDARLSSLYRDYVINAFNQNKPFDQFTIEQLAGDLLQKPSFEQKIATGYNRLNQVTGEFGANKKEYLSKYMSDRVRNVSSVWMGLTMGCAECHNHKYDPLSMKDYYSLGAFFADIKEPGLYSGRARRSGIYPPVLYQFKEETEKKIERLEKEIAGLDKELKEKKGSVQKASHKKQNKKIIAAVNKTKQDEQKARKVLEEKLKKLNRELNHLKRQGRVGMITENVAPRMIRILARGDWTDESGEIVKPAIPEILGVLKTDKERADRMDLAKWLINKKNPLTARVFVNRLWAHFFGFGLSRNLEDLGSQGDWPEHLELLNYLAAEFMEHDWDVQHMIRLIVTSDVYQQSSRIMPVHKGDPLNHKLMRQNRFRLHAELVRDSALAISGLLNSPTGGESVKPYQPNGYYDNTYGNPKRWKHDEGTKQYRRGMYAFWKRTNPHPSLLAFDKPTREECVAERSRSNTPLQALVLLNDPSYVEAARVFAEKIMNHSSSQVDDKLKWAWKVTLSRAATDSEFNELKKVYEKAKLRYSTDVMAAKKLVSVGDYPFNEKLNVVEQASFTVVARLLFNLHESITRP